MYLQTQDVSRLCDRVLHRCEWFRVTNSNINWLQRSNACRAFRKIGVEIYKNFESPKEPDKEVSEIPVDDSKQVGPWTLCEVWGDVVADYSPTNLHHQTFQGCPVDWDGNEVWRQVWLPAELSEVSRHLVLSGPAQAIKNRHHWGREVSGLSVVARLGMAKNEWGWKNGSTSIHLLRLRRLVAGRNSSSKQVGEDNRYGKKTGVQHPKTSSFFLVVLSWLV